MENKSGLKSRITGDQRVLIVVSMMAIMLKAQGIPKYTIDEQLRVAGFDPPDEPAPRNQGRRNDQPQGTRPHLSEDEDDSDDLYDASQKPRWTENAANATIADLREAALMRCSVQKVNSFIIRTRSKFELVSLLSHVLEEGLYILVPTAQAQHFGMTILHTAEETAVTQARVMCKGRNEGSVILGPGEAKGEVIPMAPWKTSSGAHISLTEIYSMLEGARAALEHASAPANGSNGKKKH